MTNFLLVPGADGQAWYWHRLIPELQRRGSEAIAVEFPKAKTATLADYADAIVETGRHWNGSPVTLVAQSLGAFSAPLVCGRLPVQQLILVNPMVPAPGETGNDWWSNTGQAPARAAAAAANGWPAEFDLETGFFHDVPADVTAQAFAADVQLAEVAGVFAEPWPLSSWPDVPTRFVQGTDDRFFPVDFQRRIARERLGLADIELVPGGHLVALSRPEELAVAVVGYLG